MFVNYMSKLIDKISNTLGLEMLMPHLPPNINKYKWVDFIQTNVLDLYSRYYPHSIKYTCIPSRDYNKITDMYTINTDYLQTKDVNILGIKGLGTEEKVRGSLPSGLVYDIHSNRNYGESYIEHATDLMTFMTNQSYFPDNLYIEFYPPHGFRITNVTYTDIIKNKRSIELELLINHPKSLITIQQGLLGQFEDLCTAKIAEFLYGNLKYFDGIETGYQSIDLKLDTIQDWANKVDDIINNIRETYLTASNKNQPLFYII